MKLAEFFQENKKVALGFSGGVDSSYLLYAAIKNGAEVCAYYVKSDFQPQFELEDAVNLANSLGAKLKILHVDVLQYSDVTENPKDRCYYCKTKIFSLIKENALRDGFNLLIDGTNASDDIDDRPGMKALEELNVRSPLRECGLIKDEIRLLSKEAGLPTWDKPAYACLATRIPTGTVITKEKLQKTENAEGELHALGFTDLRVRLIGESAKIQVPVNRLHELLSKREEILKLLKPYYKEVLIDLEGRH